MAEQRLRSDNPYVGPRTFTRAERDRYFGREREARDLLALVISQRLVLFYAQSGAGKSSLIHTTLVPRLQDEGFAVLPVARIGGELPAGLDDVRNVYLFNLMLSLDSSVDGSARFADLDLGTFLRGLTSDDGEHYYFENGLPEATSMQSDDPAAEQYEEPNYVLIIDQFEELITTFPERWQERSVFFQQLEAAMVHDPKLWVVLTLREDYVAALDPYAHLVSDRLRARYYMQRMGVMAALDAVTKPAAQAGRPFAAGAAEQLIDNLRQIRGQPSQEATFGQFVEPVQLQVVCYQLWEDLAQRPLGPITAGDLQEVGDVDKALAAFYEDALRRALQEGESQIAERRLREWFEQELITEAGTRGTVYQGPSETAGMPNGIVTDLVNGFLLRAEIRAGGAWIELVHDRFVDPILQANRRWLALYNNPLADATRRWLEAERSPEQLATESYLQQAVAYAQEHPNDVTEEERDFLLESQRQERMRKEEARRTARRRRVTLAIALALMILFAGLAFFGFTSAARARRAEAQAVSAWATAEANVALAQQELDDLEVERWLQEAYRRANSRDPLGALQALEQAALADPDRDLSMEQQAVRRQAATDLIQAGEVAAAAGNDMSAAIMFRDALGVEPPLDTPVYVWIPAGEATLGADDDDLDADFNEYPQHQVSLDGFWIQRTEVTNTQYKRCVDAGVCTRPANERWDEPQFGAQPVTDVTWRQAAAYAEWVGGRLPSEAEWEMACRGMDGRKFPWGDEEPVSARVNFADSRLDTVTNVGSRPDGKSPFGVYDMAGNVQEWTSSVHVDYPYDAEDGREEGSEDDLRTVRGGSFREWDVRCSARIWSPSDFQTGDLGFRVVSVSQP